MATEHQTPERLQFTSGASLPPLAELRDRASELSRSCQEVLAFIAMGQQHEDISATRFRAVGTVKKQQAVASNVLGVDGALPTLTVVAHCTGWFDAVGAKWVDLKPPYEPEQFRLGFEALGKKPKGVLGLRASGFTVEDTSAHLFVSSKTVKNHQANVLKALLPPRQERLRRIHTAIAGIWIEGLIDRPSLG